MIPSNIWRAFFPLHSCKHTLWDLNKRCLLTNGLLIFGIKMWYLLIYMDSPIFVPTMENFNELEKVQCKPTFVIAVQLLSHVQLLVTPLSAAFQAPLSITVSWSLLKLSYHLILCCLLLLLPSIFPSIRVQWVCSSLELTKVLELQLHTWKYNLQIMENTTGMSRRNP